jgi:hypothetical protein
MSKHLVSFITATRSEENAEGLRKNLEIIFGEKNKNPLLEWDLLPQVGFDSIFAAYNNGAAKAVGDILVFLHDDVKLLCNYLSFEQPLAMVGKPFCGFLGVAGATALDETATWWNSKHTDLRGMVAHPGDNEFRIQWNHWPWGQAASFGQVVVLDGCFLMVDKKKFERIGGFDAESYTGFHFYDIQATFAAHQRGFQNRACPIPMLHSSPGKPNETWQANRQIFVEKHKKQLPCKL